MDRKRNIGNRSNLRPGASRLRPRLNRRRPRRLPRPNRNRLSRAQNNLRRNRLGFNLNSRRRRFNNFRRRINLGLRIIFVGNLPFDVTSRRLRQLFQNEGRITDARIARGPMGSKGYGFVEFYNPRNAWKSIMKWNKTTLGGRVITVQYRKRRRNIGNRRRNNFNNYNNYRGNNQFRRGNRGGFRPRGRRY